MTDFGVDLSSADDLDETRTVSGVELVAQDAVWRLKTPTSMGILEADAPGYGFDLLEAIGSVATADDAAALPGRIAAELKDDERILDVTATVVRTGEGPSERWDITIRCTTADGPFSLVGFVSDGELELAVKLLPGGV